MQTWYRGDMMPGNLVNFNCRPYTAIYESGYFAGSEMFVPFLHQIKDYIFGLSILLDTF